MQNLKFNITDNKTLTPQVCAMWLEGCDISAHDAVKSIRPGQFVNIALDGCYLRRPFSVCDVDENKIRIVYKIVGTGTAIMKDLPVGATLDILLPLGNGFDISLSGNRPLLIGGGVGVPPMLLLAKQLVKRSIAIDVVLGFNTADEIILADEFASLGCNVHLATIDGTAGCKGYVTDTPVIAESNTHGSFFYACGPVAMLRAIQRQLEIPGQISMEERMGCGFGICMGCTCKTSAGTKQVCTNGPVFMKEDIMF